MIFKRFNFWLVFVLLFSIAINLLLLYDIHHRNTLWYIVFATVNLADLVLLVIFLVKDSKKRRINRETIDKIREILKRKESN